MSPVGIASAMPSAAALAQFRIASIHIAMQNLPAASEALRKVLAIRPDYLEAQLARSGSANASMSASSYWPSRTKTRTSRSASSR